MLSSEAGLLVLSSVARGYAAAHKACTYKPRRVVAGSNSSAAVHFAKSDIVPQIDTSNILFICGGAFVDLDRQVAERTATSSIGFGNPVRCGLPPGWQQALRKCCPRGKEVCMSCWSSSNLCDLW